MRLRDVAFDRLLGVNRLVGEEDSLAVGAHTVRFHHAPGHTNDSMIVDVAGHIMTGDFLFTGDGGVGRDDLPSGRVDEHWEALAVLSRFPGEAIVCTGHDPQAPPCRVWHGTKRTIPC